MSTRKPKVAPESIEKRAKVEPKVEKMLSDDDEEEEEEAPPTMDMTAGMNDIFGGVRDSDSDY